MNAAKETGASHIGVYVAGEYWVVCLMTPCGCCSPEVDTFSLHAGPTPLLQSAHMVVSKLNSFRSKTFFDYHKMAGFL